VTAPPEGRGTGALLALALLAGLLAGLAYRGALDAGWVWDDRLVVTQQLPRFHGVGDAFFPAADVPRLIPQYYRPVIIVSWLIDDARARRAAGVVGEPSGSGRGEGVLDAARQRAFHQTNVLLHAANAALVVLLAAALVGFVGAPGPARRAAGVAAGLLFALHPIAVEPVTWAAGRSDLLMTLFLLAALLAFAGGMIQGVRLLLAVSGALLLLALLCKESALGALPAFGLLASEWPSAAEGRRPGVRRRAAFAPLALALVAYAALRIIAAGASAAPPLGMTAGGIADAMAVLGWYAERLVWPVPMAVFVPGVFSVPRAVLGVALIAAVGALAARSVRRGGDWVPPAVGASLFLGPLLPTLAAVVGELAPVVAAERYLYLPLAGFGIVASSALATAAARLGRRKVPSRAAPWLLVAVVALVLVPAWRATAARVQVWADEERLWTLAVEQAPGVLLPHLNLGLAHDRAGRSDEAIAEYRRAAEGKGSDRGRALALSHLGAALLSKDRLEEAVAALSGSVALDPRAARTQYNLAHALVRQADRTGDAAARDNLLRAALPHFEAALESDPEYVLARFHYGDVLARLGQVEAGIAALEEGLARAPDHSHAAQARSLIERLKRGQQP
jgi:tetratricopeptide (TPR) repeat protein